ncbi:MAG: ABC transporter ATP-binding protein [Waddliaceae bacterium]
MMEKSLFDNLRVILIRYRRRFFKGFVLLLFANLLLVLNPLVFRQAVNSLDPSVTPSGGFLSDALEWIMGSGDSVWPWACLLLLTASISAIFKYWMRMIFVTVSREVEVEVRAKLFRRIQSQSMAFFDRHGVGSLLSRLTNDISAYRDMLGPGIMYPLFFLTLVIPGLWALFIISVPLAILSLIPMLVIPLMNFAVRDRIYQMALRLQATLAAMSNMVQEHFSSIRVIKNYGIELAAWKRFKDLSFDLMKTHLHLSWLQGSLFPTFNFLTKVTTTCFILFSGVIILQAWIDLTTGDFVSFMWIQSYIFFPVIMLGWLLPIYEKGRAAYHRLVEIYEEPIEVQDRPTSHFTIPPGANIIFRRLTFTYPTASHPSLVNINLEIEGGSFVGLTGPIGAGKSTVFHLLNREYEIPRGMILINNRDIHDYPLKAFHGQIVTVEQAPFLFSKSILENVRFGRREATVKELELVSQYADFHETVLEFPEQYETLIGERGVMLSGGQKQRLAMARAFLVNRSILLLDDVFSAVDADTENKIFRAIKENFRGKTILLVTHRISILEQMDRVIYLSGGSVLEDGTPDELMAARGHFAALAELQRQGNAHT